MSLEKGKISTTCTVPASTSMELLLRNLTARLDEISGRMKKLEKDVTKAIDAMEDRNKMMAAVMVSLEQRMARVEKMAHEPMSDALYEFLASMVGKDKEEEHKEDRRDPHSSTPKKGRRKKDKIN